MAGADEEYGSPAHGGAAAAQAQGQGAFHTGGAAGVGVSSEGIGRDRDPAPSYDGIDPEVTFQQYERMSSCGSTRRT